MDSATEISICDSDSEQENNSLIISEILNDVSRTEYIKIKNSLLSSDIGSDQPLPIFNSLWDYITLSYNNGLIEKILIYEYIKKELSRVDPEVVHIKIENQAHLQIIYDLERETSYKFKYHGKTRGQHTIHFPFEITEVAKFFISIIDQFFIMLTKNILYDDGKNGEIDSIVFPYPGRDESVRPIIDKMSSNTLVVVDSRSPWPNLFGYNYPSNWGDHNVRTYNSFASASIILSQLRLFVHIIIESTVTKSLEHEIIQHIDETRGSHLRYTIQHTLQESYKGRLFDFKRAIISKDIFRQYNNSKRIITGSNGSMYRPIRYFARKAKLKDYYIPHAIVHPIETDHPPHSETTMFVAGEFDRKIMSDNFPNIPLPNIVPLGRPYFNHLQNGRDFASNCCGLTIMLATQKLEPIRDEFVIDILSFLDKRRDVEKVIIKTHPSESTMHYSELCSSIDLKIVKKVKIYEKDLEKHIRSSDILFTINSNVGIESMILGTPSVSYNKWQPRIPSYPYATKGPGILLTSQKELQTFIQDLDQNQLKKLSTDMMEFAEVNYKCDIDAEEKIAEFIES